MIPEPAETDIVLDGEMTRGCAAVFDLEELDGATADGKIAVGVEVEGHTLTLVLDKSEVHL